MAVKVRYLAEDQIERDAIVLLREYELAQDLTIAPPIPVEEILESHLGLTLDFDDLHEKLDLPIPDDGPEVFGALWVDARSVFIDQSLDPEDHPGREGRYRFTLGHEIGHWRLHRECLRRNLSQLSLFAAGAEPTLVCRTSQAKEPIEWQADFFAANLLMPREMVVESWQGRFGDRRSRIVRGRKESPRQHASLSDLKRSIAAYEHTRHSDTLDSFARPFAEQFGVSPIAMRIRLEKLGLLHHEVPRQRSLGTAS